MLTFFREADECVRRYVGCAGSAVFGKHNKRKHIIRSCIYNTVQEMFLKEHFS